MSFIPVSNSLPGILVLELDFLHTKNLFPSLNLELNP